MGLEPPKHPNTCTCSDFAGGWTRAFTPNNKTRPQLILTAIVVGISTLALGLAIVVRIREEYGSIEEHKTQEMDRVP